MAIKMTCDKVRELASGFVLGALDTDDLIAVQDHLDACLHGHPEIDDLGGVVSYLGLTVDPVEPPAWLRDSVIAAAKADLQASRRVGKVAEKRAAEPIALVIAAEEPIAEKRGNIISLSAFARRRRALAVGLTAVAAVIALIVGGVAFVLPGQSATPSDMQLYVREPGARVLTVQGTVSGTMVVRPTGHLVIQLGGLEQTRGDEVYAVWITAKNGVVSKLATFRVDGTGSIIIDAGNVPNSASLWVNICKEPNGNVTKPTGPSVVSGSIPL